MNWRLFSGDNSEMDIKAVLAGVACFVAILVYAAYAIKGFFVEWDMPASIRDITVALVAGGIVGASSTLLNQKLGVQGPAPPQLKSPEQPEELEGPVG